MYPKRVIITAVILAATASLPATAAKFGGGGIGLLERDSLAFDRDAAQCQSSTRGAELNRCVAKALQRLITCLRTGSLAAAAPQAASILSTAQTQIAAAKTQPAAVSVLTRAQAVVAALAAKGSGDAAIVYGYLSRALSRAQAAIGGRG
jgi:hypothetical protein